MINTSDFWRTIISGFIATFVMSMVGFLQSGLGLPVIDVGYFLTESFNLAHEVDPYTILWGNAAYYMFGIILALIWVAMLQKRIPGNWFIQGIIFGVLITLLAGLVVSPLVSMAAGEPFGIFYIETWIPGLIILAGLTMHLAYGLVLMICLKYAGVKPVS
jgi:uncharacterized membrane protein YagU involved in acid resistance